MKHSNYIYQGPFPIKMQHTLPKCSIYDTFPVSRPTQSSNSAETGDRAACGTLISETTEPSNTVGTALRLRGESKGLSPALFWFNPLQTAKHTPSKADNYQGLF